MTAQQLINAAAAYEASADHGRMIIADIDAMRRFGADSGWWDHATEPMTDEQVADAVAELITDEDDAPTGRAAWVALHGSIHHMRNRAN
jgi:hypothetical protein